MMAKAVDKKKLVATLKAFEKEYGIGSIFHWILKSQLLLLIDGLQD